MTVFTQKERFVFQFLIISVAIGLSVGTIRKTYFKPEFSEQIENEIAEFKSLSIDIDESKLNYTQEDLSKSDDIKPKISVKSININTALKKDLLRLPKIGPITAERIIQYRDVFAHLNQLKTS